MRGRIAPAVAAMAAVLCLSACDRRPDQWDAFIYPDRSDPDSLQKIEGFRTFELCRKAARDRVQLLPAPAYADYVCGHRCGTRPGKGSARFCAETGK